MHNIKLMHTHTSQISFVDQQLLSLAQQMGIDSSDIRHRLENEGFDKNDASKIRSLSSIVCDNAETFSRVFFDHLASLEGTAGLMKSRSLLELARMLKLSHLKAMMRGEYGEAYVEERLRMGSLYSRAGLDARAILGAFRSLIRAIGYRVMTGVDKYSVERFDAFMSLMKIFFFDIGLIIDTLVFERERTIRLQQEAIRELSTPILQLTQGLLILPLIGLIDTARASQIMTNLLYAVRQNRTKAIVIDITGVPKVDANVANYIARAVRTTAMMGAHAVLTGLSAEVARSLVEQNVSLGQFETYATLQDGVEAVTTTTLNPLSR